MPATTGMKGAGYYDQHSGTQLSSIQALQDCVDEAVASLSLPDAVQPITVLDLGSSEGRRAGLFPVGVYHGAVGGSFYGPLLPPSTVHFATSFNAIHWLDRLPAVP